MSRRLDDLDLKFRPLAIELIARCVEARIPVYIVDTLRTAEEHQANLKAGRSWIKRSKHMDGLAIDIVPYTIFNADGPDKLNWDADSPVWENIGKIGEKLGLRWGGRWPKRDMGHFEYVEPPANPRVGE